MQKVFETSKPGPNKNLNNAFFILDCGSYKNTKSWVAKLLLLFQLHVQGRDKEKELVFLLHVEVTPSCNNVYRALECKRLWWSTDEDIDNFLVQKYRSSGAQDQKTGERVGVEAFCSSNSKAHVVRENLEAAPFLHTYNGFSDASTLTTFIERTANVRTRNESVINVSRENSKTNGSIRDNMSWYAGYLIAQEKAVSRLWK